MLNALLVVGDRAAPPAPLTKRQSRRERLEAVLAAAVEDPFTREWWEAATSNNLIALKALITRPELNRLSSRELASLSDGLTEFGSNEVQEKLMALAQDRFPGEFWVHFRLAFMRANHKDTQHEALRHLTAAVAARPRSGIARAALGMELLERHKDPAGRRLLKSASEVDPSSPWPHLFLGLQALDENNWTEACAALKSAIRADPDSAYFMIHSTIFLATRGHPAFAVPDEHTARVIEELAAVAPDHPGGADLLGELRLKQKDGRASLAAFRTADRLAGTDYARKPLIAYQLAELEAKARWEGKIDDILSGKIDPKDGAELANAAGYCVLFEKKYALAVRLASARLAADPERYKTTANITEFAGWAVQAAAGLGADGTGLTPAERSRLRQQALSWLREADAQTGKELRQIFAFQLHSNPDLEPVRAGKLLRTLPPAERDAWAAFWATIPNPLAPAEVVPAPRELKEPR